MLVTGTVADVVDVGMFSDRDGERAGLDERKERQAMHDLSSMYTISGCAWICGLRNTHQQNGQQ
jgi:hypothetical protein